MPLAGTMTSCARYANSDKNAPFTAKNAKCAKATQRGFFAVLRAPCGRKFRGQAAGDFAVRKLVNASKITPAMMAMSATLKMPVCSHP